jgi:hypothetical protein
MHIFSLEKLKLSEAVLLLVGVGTILALPWIGEFEFLWGFLKIAYVIGVLLFIFKR